MHTAQRHPWLGWHGMCIVVGIHTLQLRLVGRLRTYPKNLEEKTVAKNIQKVPHTERELERKVPESTHDNFGGQSGKSSALPEQVKHDARETKERLEKELDESKSDNQS